MEMLQQPVGTIIIFIVALFAYRILEHFVLNKLLGNGVCNEHAYIQARCKDRCEEMAKKTEIIIISRRYEDIVKRLDKIDGTIDKIFNQIDELRRELK